MSTDRTSLPAPGAFAGLPTLSTPMQRTAALCGLFFLALLARSAWLLVGGRMWAEEGLFYYGALQDAGLGTALTLVVRGNYQLLGNAAAWLAGAVPAVWAAHVTTGLALAAACVTIGLLARLSVERSWSAWTAALAVLVLAWMPSGYELYLTSTNIQWMCSTSVVLLLLSDPAQWTRPGRHAATAWIAACALSGVPAVTMAPLMLLRGCRDRSRLHGAWGLILAAGALVQLAVIGAHSHADRTFGFDPLVALLATPLQAVLSPLLGVQWLHHLAGASGALGASAIVVVVGAALVVAVGRTLMSDERSRRLAFTLAAASGLAIVVNLFGALGDRNEVVSTWLGGRYFFLAQTCWVIALLAAANTGSAARRAVAAGLLGLGVLTGWTEARTGLWKEFVIAGPSWRASVERCGDRRPCDVLVWPMAHGKTVELRRP